MSQSTDLTISNQLMPNARTEINNIFAALGSNHKGGSAPSYILTGMCWIDDTATPWVVNWYDGTDNIEQGRINPTTNKFFTQANLIDSNGNEVLEHTATTSAVNHFSITNAATGNSPALVATGSDTNIDITLTPKGSGVVNATNINAQGKVAFADDGELTISSGAVTATGSHHTVDTESDAASDDLDTINGGIDGMILIIRAENAARTVIIKNGTGNIQTPDGSDITLDELTKEVVLKYDTALNDWHVLSISAGGVSTVNAIGSIGGGTQDINLNSGRSVTATVDTSATTFTFSNPKVTGNEDIFTLRLTNGGSQTVNWPSSVDWIGGIAPTLTASGVDELTFKTVDGGTIWVGVTALDVK